MAIVDPRLTLSLPPAMTADTGIDALTHALEAGVSIFASPYTDAFCLQAINLILDALPRALRRRRRPRGAHRRWPTRRRSPASRSRTRSSASTTRSRTPSARASASPTAARTRIFLPHVLRYNAVAADASSCRRPATGTTSRREKYAQIAWVLGLGGRGEEERRERLFDARRRAARRGRRCRARWRAAGSRATDFEAALPDLARAAFADPSIRTNPRIPLVARAARAARGRVRGALNLRRGRARLAHAPCDAQGRRVTPTA